MIVKSGSPSKFHDDRDNLAAGFEYVSDRYYRLFRFLYPEQLLSELTLDDQAAKLADWILRCYADISSDPPGPPPGDA